MRMFTFGLCIAAVVLGVKAGDAADGYGKVDYDTKYETQKYDDGKQDDDKIFLAVLDRKQQIKFVEVNSHYNTHKPHIVDIDTESAPMVLRFNSATSKIKIQQNHKKHGAEVEESRHVEEPHHFKLHVHKPVIQDVHEVITPFRNIYQEIRPVVENVQIVVSKAGKKEKKENNYDDSQYESKPKYSSKYESQKHESAKYELPKQVKYEQKAIYEPRYNNAYHANRRPYEAYQHRAVQY